MRNNKYPHLQLRLKIKYMLKFLRGKILYKCSDKRTIFIVGSPNHKNCGDIAISLAEYKVLSDFFPNDRIIDVDMSEYYPHYSSIKKICAPNDVFALIGGGNFGNQYMFDEGIRRHLISHFPENKVVLFPQSIYFTPDSQGKREKAITQQYYNAHPNLVLCARDPISYKIMQEIFHVKVLHVPDIVLYLQETDAGISRRGALLCLRSDLEGVLKVKDKQIIWEYLHKQYLSVKTTDTMVEYDGDKPQKMLVFKQKLKEFQSAELVITDRIHGMIFSAITSTPCIVLSNYNHKVKGAYQWISNLPYIRYVESITDVPNAISELKRCHNDLYSNQQFMDRFEEIIAEMSSVI